MNYIEELTKIHNSIMQFRKKLDGIYFVTDQESMEILEEANKVVVPCLRSYGEYNYLFRAAGDRFREIYKDFWDRIDGKGEYADNETVDMETCLNNIDVSVTVIERRIVSANGADYRGKEKFIMSATSRDSNKDAKLLDVTLQEAFEIIKSHRVSEFKVIPYIAKDATVLEKT